jgi:hypothetical protein
LALAVREEVHQVGEGQLVGHGGDSTSGGRLDRLPVP